ncbi:MAG TPA: hypothetical protein VGX92_15570 [Pyrinomonadaceae bacterium]|jgi:hypothetical protein|nr:hypothetical protein [Pyrinomonadaceae bacterium]
MTFAELLKTLDWRPIRHCPGRYVLRGAKSDLRVEELIGGGFEVSAYRQSSAPDVVLVAALDEGGVISYEREDGSLLHTLNTPEGFHRKLRQLGIELH